MPSGLAVKKNGGNIGTIRGGSPPGGETWLQILWKTLGTVRQSRSCVGKIPNSERLLTRTNSPGGGGVGNV